MPLFPTNVHGTYKIIAAGLLQGLRNLGIPAEMVSRSSRHAVLVKKDTKDPACFSSPSWYEILVHDRKIIGSAQRRLSGAFLQHGSILIGYDPALEAEVIPGGGSGDVVTSITPGARQGCSSGRREAGIHKRVFRSAGDSIYDLVSRSEQNRHRIDTSHRNPCN